MFARASTSETAKQATVALPSRAPERHDRGAQLQRTIGNHRALRLVQAKLAVSEPGDPYEKEAERVSHHVMRMDAASAAPPAIQRLCTECEDELHRSAVPGSEGAAADAEGKLRTLGAGQPLTREQRAFFEPRFGLDFRDVRIHSGGAADAAARSVGALAFTHRRDIVFRSDQYRPDTLAGRRLLAHELTHVVQQRAAGWPGGVVQRRCEAGEGLEKPGDCSWAKYLTLRLAVETAKTVTGIAGECEQSSSCLELAMKIAALSAEIVARFTLQATCFRGGDKRHCDEIDNKIRALERCWRNFSRTVQGRPPCSPDLITKAAVVVEYARQVIATAAVAAAMVVAVALIYALIALIEVIVAAIAAAAAAAVAAIASAPIASAAAALTTLLMLLLREIGPVRRPPSSA